MPVILSCLVGSRIHGAGAVDSDVDYTHFDTSVSELQPPKKVDNLDIFVHPATDLCNEEALASPLIWPGFLNVVDSKRGLGEFIANAGTKMANLQPTRQYDKVIGLLEHDLEMLEERPMLAKRIFLWVDILYQYLEKKDWSECLVVSPETVRKMWEVKAGKVYTKAQLSVLVEEAKAKQRPEVPDDTETLGAFIELSKKASCINI